MSSISLVPGVKCVQTQKHSYHDHLWSNFAYDKLRRGVINFGKIYSMLSQISVQSSR
ncbi:uncharacterized protein VDAG_05680 [Verticillium dahliae VdLs.17]|uniref:Uncharacterized protein n=1 Tax=Verticillium dahliae (strain VdLs.17 / ATCC MYA-4575 / FGSC 10137) TaxID=498257 RepID=G2X698_VERDV|nr:uncharacterized protein VDAG_05680 [Verticillium dahliae VdLs.17]EGY14516.1 hypothetical protein VDAG_05680 [Verticillium dahliae VdLs.17]